MKRAGIAFTFVTTLYFFSSVFLCILLCFCGCGSAEQITLTTYYPAPFGVYKQLEIHDDLTFADPAGGGTELITKTDANANLHLDSPTQSRYHIIFDDVTEGGSTVDRPFCYLKRYLTGASITYCADDYVAVNFLDDNKWPVDNPGTNAPATGYVVCIRGWD
jgi:hypothetical protein